MGRALMDYRGFARQGFRVAAAFDKKPQQIGKKVGGLQVRHIAELPEVVQRMGIEIAVVAVPPAEAQAVIDSLVRSGIKAILNYAPVAARVPADVRLRQIDPVLTLQTLTYYLKQSKGQQTATKSREP